MTKEFARRIAFTIGALLLFRVGMHIPVAGISTSSAPLLPSAVARLSIFSLGLIPYLTAAIFIQLLSVVWRGFGSLQRSGEAGRRKVGRFTLLLTLLFAAFQAYGIATAIQRIPGIVADPDGWFALSATASMVGGVFFLIWLSEQITRHGVGNGLALILSVGILIALPGDIAGIVDLVQRGEVSGNLALAHTIFWLATVAVIVLLEKARRNVRVEFAERRAGDRVLPARPAVLPIKINSAGYLIPVTVAPWIIFLPLSFAGFILGGDHPWVAAAYQHLGPGRPVHLILGSLAVFVLAFVYTAFVVDPEQAADSLAKQGGTIAGVAPGEATADHLDRVISLTTVIGAVYLTVLQLIPEVFVAYGNALPYSMNGGAALIVVCTIIDIQTQVRDVSLTSPGGVRR
jgi:preprotein translocase subunit SecY